MVGLGSETPLSQLSMGSFINDEIGDTFCDSQGIPAMSDITATPYMTGLMMNISATDLHTLQSDNKLLNIHIQDLQIELAAEQETVNSLRKKLNSSERERLDRFTATNDDMSRMSTESMNLRSQLEQGEAKRQTLEYEVMKLQRLCEENQISTTNRETAMNNSHMKMKTTIIELNKRLSQMQNDNEQLKATSKQEISLLNLAAATMKCCLIIIKHKE